MARLLMAGFETGDTLATGADSTAAISWSGFVPTVSVGLVTATPSPRSGTYCLKAACGGSSGTMPFGTGNYWATFARKTLAHASKTDLWYAFGLLHHQTITAMVGTGGGLPMQPFFATIDTAGNVNCLLSLDAGLMRAYYATAGGAIPNHTQMTQIGSSAAVSIDTWHLLEVHIVAATGATGTFELYLDGSQIINATSQRTAQTNANLGGFQLGYIFSGTTSSTGATLGNVAGGYYAFDDLRVNDTTGSVNNGRPSDGRILGLIPNGVGTTIGGTPLTSSSGGANYTNVDDVPPSTSDYNSGTSVGTGETYTLSNPSVAGGAQAVNVIAYVRNVDNGGGNVGLTTKTAAGTSEGSAQPITAAATYYSRLLESDPADAAAWSDAKLTALEAGVTIR